MYSAEQIRERRGASGAAITAEDPKTGRECPLCKQLEALYEARAIEYIEARSSASYAICKKLAAQKNVEMERARYELEEHRVGCRFAGARLPKPEVPQRSRQLVA